MKKILLIIQREYLTRVKKKAFIVMTFLVPALFIGMYAIIIALMVNRDDFTNVKVVEVVDETGVFKSRLKSTKTIKFHAAADFSKSRRNLKDSGNDYLLHIPKGEKNVLLLSQKKPGLETITMIESQLNKIDKTDRLLAAGIDTALVNRGSEIEVQARQLTEEGEKDGGAWVALGIGFVGSLLIYMSLFIYGVQVMRGVIEEKTNRIIEVVISSVKPFQLMLGKIIGVALVGLTQFLLWIVLTAGLAAGAGMLFVKKSDISKLKTEQSSALSGGTPAQKNLTDQAPGKVEQVMESLNSVNWFYTLSVFFFYFLGGFMLYSALFAAVGSAVDSETDAQQFMLPVTLPLIFTFILSMNFVISNPDSPLSFWLSIIPLTSPIAMMIRVPFGVPAWELALSMALMIAGFILVTWIAARIYRVGILMYGKKASYKELIKWFSYKE